jgi:hypothetical protein
LHQFRNLEPGNILQAMGPGIEDHHYRDFLPVACRFEPVVATEKAREILSGLLTRTGFPLRQLIFNGEDHAPLMQRDMASQLRDRVVLTDMIETLPEQDRDSLRMFLFNYVAGHLTPAEQLDCLTGKIFGPDFLLDVIPSLKPQKPEAIRFALQTALDLDDEEAAYGVLVAALHGDVAISAELESLILRFCNARSSKLRAIYFQLATCQNLVKIRKAHVGSNWSAEMADAMTYESWFGSILLVAACANGELTVDAMLIRISSKTWFLATKYLGEIFAKPFAYHFMNQLRSAVEASKNLSLPIADLTFSNTESAPFALLSVNEDERHKKRFPQQKNLADAFGSADEFHEKQLRLHAMANAFFEGIKGSEARLLVERVTIEDLRLIADANPTLLPQILDVLESATNTELVWLKNLAFTTANLVSQNEPDRAIVLFRRALATEGFVTHALGDDLTFEHEAIWSSKDSKAMRCLWRKRLLQSGNDAVLAREVLAAERFGASIFIKAFAAELDSSASTLDQAYAISISGFSNQSAEMVGFIERHMDDHGMVGEAAKHAKVSHDAAQWAAQWVHQMWDAPSSEEFWRCLLVAKTTIDARAASQSKLGSDWIQMAPVYRRVRKAAIEEQNKAREKKFLGQEAPDRIFVAEKV